MNGKAGWIEERSINDKIGEILRSLHPQWGEGGEGGIVTENTQMLVEGKGKKPDIVVWHPGGLPVVIESEYHPAPNVEKKDARPRLGQTLNTSEAVEQVIALRLPKHLREVDQARLLDEVRDARFEFCLISEKSSQNPLGRWPEKGWIQGGVEDLATFIEHTSLSEKRMIQGMEILIEGVNAAAVMYQSGCHDEKQTAIAKKLHQPKNEQTARMAMAIIANAFTFQSAIVGKEDVKTISQMKNSETSFKNSVIEEWKRICEDINYVPIFLISADIVDQIDDKTAQNILETLSNVSAKLSTLGATTQHDFSGRLFQRLISDRKYLATFYTLPESATLLAEIAISRLGVNWKDKIDVTSLRVADFACGTGALLNAAYGAILARYRRGGGWTLSCILA